MITDTLKRVYAQIFDPLTKAQAGEACEVRDLVIIGEDPQKGYWLYIKEAGKKAAEQRYETEAAAKKQLIISGYKV